MDMEVELFEHDGKLAVRTWRKEMSIYDYCPPTSAHHPSWNGIVFGNLAEAEPREAAGESLAVLLP